MDQLTAADFQAFATLGAAAGRAMGPAIVELAGVEYPATVPAPRRGADLIAGGTLDKGELKARILASDLATRPAENTLLRWKRLAGDAWSADWIVTEVSDSPIDTEWHLSCVPAN
jgi:hypothetical protein